MSTPMTVEFDLHLQRRGHGGRQEMHEGPAPAAAPPRVPRVAKLLALAHRFERLIRAGEFADYTAIARVGGVTRARLSQIMALLNLAPDIQESILHLPRIERGRDPVVLRDMLPIAMELEWRRQRSMWQGLFRRNCR